MENSRQSLNVYCRKRCLCSKTEKLSKVKCNGSNLRSMRRWKTRCGLCMPPCLPVEEKEFWHGVYYGVLVYVW